MLPGPIQIIECPHCAARAAVPTLLSGNTFGARFWTDGEMDAPMLPREPEFLRCETCGGTYWRDDVLPVDERDPWSGGEALTPEMPLVEEAGPDDSFAALERGDLPPDRRLTLRLLAWRRANDPHRDLPADQSVPPYSDRQRANLKALAHGLDGTTDPDEVILRADVLRSLGRFDEANSQLQVVTDSEYAEIVALERALCERGDPGVREVGGEA